jgi:hypothetical protein
MGSIEHIESVFIQHSGRPLTSRYCIIARTNHQLIFAAIPEDAVIPKYYKFAESERKNGRYVKEYHSLELLEIPKKILEKYHMMDPEQILKETPGNFSINSHDIKKVSYTLIPTTLSHGFDPNILTFLVPGDPTIEYGYKISIIIQIETIVGIIRYEENVLDRLELLFGKKLEEAFD